MLNECTDEADGPEHIGRDGRFRGLQKRAGRVPVLNAHDAGHRHYNVEIGMSREHEVCGLLNAGWVGGIDADRVEVWVLEP